MRNIRSGAAYPDSLPGGDLRAVLARRAAVLAAVRAYFEAQGVLEVTTPQLGRYPVSDPHLKNFVVDNPLATEGHGRERYLQTSPESAMKQLLARGSGSIYQICQAFRVDPPGNLHEIEFTMLEWYRTGFGLADIIRDTTQLAGKLVKGRPVETCTYRELFIDRLGIDPLDSDAAALEATARSILDVDLESADPSVWLDLLFSHQIAPDLGKGSLCVVRDFPPAQAAMSEITSDRAGHRVAARFELFIEGVEIANGYRELTDWREQEARFGYDNQQRSALGLQQVPVDQDLLAAMRDPGLPQCAGVALGIDRLLLFVDNQPA